MKSGCHVCGCVGMWMCGNLDGRHRILKSERRRSTNPATTGCPKAARNCRRAWPSVRTAAPFDRATRRSRVGTAEAGAQEEFLLVHILLHANPGFKTRFECRSRCTSTADAGLPHPHTRNHASPVIDKDYDKDYDKAPTSNAPAEYLRASGAPARAPRRPGTMTRTAVAPSRPARRSGIRHLQWYSPEASTRGRKRAGSRPCRGFLPGTH